MSANIAENKILKRLGLKHIDECLRFPKYFEFETINMCNARCVMCTIEKWHDDGSKKRIMTDKLFQKFVDEVKDYADWIENIYLCRNGEPTLDKNIASRIKALKDMGIKNVNISTNASIIDEVMALKLIDSGLNEIMFSIDSNRKQVFEKIRRGLKFDTVFNNILNFINLRDKKRPEMLIRVRMVIQKENQDEVNEWLEFWKSKTNRETDRVEAMPDHFWGRERTSGDLVLYDYESPCVSPFGTMVVLYDGNVPMCSPDYSCDVLMGNINNATVKEIWNSQEFDKLRSIHLAGKRSSIKLCENCSYWDRKKIN